MFIFFAIFQFQCATHNNKIKSINGRDVTFTEMDKYICSQMDSLKLPGLSIAIINDAKIVYHRTFGVTNVETNGTVSDETLFDTGSLSKTPFTYLVMKLVDQGILNLDQPLYTYLPYPDIAYDERYKLITARMNSMPYIRFPKLEDHE